MSLDLNKLANKLDEALSNETTETLTKFLKDKRMSNNKQSSMDKEFVPYEEALALKELGFDETCFGSYCQTPKFDEGTFMLGNTYNLKAPTYSQAFRWFREKFNIFSNIDKTSYGKFIYNIKPYKVFYDEEYFLTYEEAELECLRKLIEIQGGDNE